MSIIAENEQLREITQTSGALRGARREAALGKSTITVTPPPSSGLREPFELREPFDAADTAQYLADSRRLRYARLDTAARVLSSDRVAKCSRMPVPGTDYVHIKHNGSSASYGNLTTCGSVWVCPVCSARVNMERRVELQEAISSTRSFGGGAYLLTMTIQHTSSDSLAGLLDVLVEAWRRTKRGKPWSRVLERYGVVGHVTVLEVTYGDNGWHPHKHALLFTKVPLSAAQVSALEAWLSARFCRMASKLGGYASPRYGADLRGGPLDDRGIDEVTKYVTKFGLDSELTDTGGKEAHGFTPFQLLDSLVFNDKTAALFQEYAAAMKGRRQLVWSRGLRDLLGLSDERGDVEIAQDDLVEPSVVIMTLTGFQFAQVTLRGLRGELLAFASSCPDAEKIWLWLQSHRVKLRPDKVGDDYRRAKVLGRLKRGLV